MLRSRVATFSDCKRKNSNDFRFELLYYYKTTQPYDSRLYPESPEETNGASPSPVEGQFFFVLTSVRKWSYNRPPYATAWNANAMKNTANQVPT